MYPLKQIKPGLIIATLLALLPAVGHIALETYISFNPGADFPLTLLQGALFIGWVVLFIFALPFAFWKKKGKYMLFWPVSILLLWMATQLVQGFPSPNNVAIPDDIHFKAEYSKYEAIVKKAPLRKHIFKWGRDGFVGTASTEKSIVYDPGDALSTLNQAKNRRWKLNQLKRGEPRPAAIITTRAMGGHYYLVEETDIPW